MSITDITNARKNLYDLIHSVNVTHEPLEIIGKENNAVLIGAQDWQNIQETLYLLHIPHMRESIIDGMNTPISEMTTQLEW